MYGGGPAVVVQPAVQHDEEDDDLRYYGGIVDIDPSEGHLYIINQEDPEDMLDIDLDEEILATGHVDLGTVLGTTNDNSPVYIDPVDDELIHYGDEIRRVEGLTDKINNRFNEDNF